MSKTALIVEDEIFVALDLERILIDAGYHVAAIAADRASALEAAPDCGFAFVDVNLRDGPTGPDIARRIAADHGIKVVFVTANPTQIGDGNGALGYVRKPFSEAAILAAAAIATQTDAPANAEVVPFERPAAAA
ncbi:response regulator [Sphingomonas rubra]|uniref:Response regulator receiver domain-containing protein n=1 Tax=Sphingomonas rubra TaxID=634430 RepID=A0A1I5RC36_9SPHN|nr:response regulator [Sphingomonas rubra]SFP56083.1 Response regulator receiver domain-containing protein [Sphingomonas rubra]